MQENSITHRKDCQYTPRNTPGELIKTEELNCPCLVGVESDTITEKRRNNHILTGYRKNYNSVSRVLKSLFLPHNETFNIWSHIMGFNLFLAFMVYVLNVNKVPGYFGA
jgi:hypothetical protein